jgi:GT2 family glycosyltransferase
MTPTVAAVLVNYNSGTELRRALESIEREASGAWEAVVVDNASTDGSEAAALDFPPVRLLRNRDNVGFARGVNQAVAECHAGRILVMNPDCQLMPGALRPLMAILDGDARCAIVAPTGLFGRTSSLRRTLPGLDVARRNVVAGTKDDESIGVDWVSGACMLVRREAMASVGGFDERYFMYWEDADLCRRLRERGHTIRYVPAASAVHRVGHSSRTARTQSVRAFHDSAYLYYSTHVARSPLNPKRWIARGLLTMRCWWKLASIRPT